MLEIFSLRKRNDILLRSMVNELQHKKRYQVLTNKKKPHRVGIKCPKVCLHIKRDLVHITDQLFSDKHIE